MLLGLFLYIVITLYVFFVPYYLLTKKYSHEYSFVDRLLGAFVLGISQIILTEVALGFAFRLGSLNLFLLNMAVSTGILIYAGISRKDLAKQLKEARNTFASFFALVFRHRILSIIFILSVIQVFWWSLQVYLFPPYAWDELAYHLPKVAHILQSNGIEEFKTISPWVNTYPFNIELLFLWNVIYLGNDVLVNGTQVVFALFAVLAIYGIARKVGVKPENAAFAMTFLFIPIVIQQATTCYIDLAISSMFVIAANFLLLKDKPKINLIILGLSLGIMVGAKYIFILPGLVILLVLLLLILYELRTERYIEGHRFLLFRKRFMEDFFLCIIPILLIGGIWYVRNYILYGNPVAPVEVTLLGKTLFHGSETLNNVASGTPTFTNPAFIINAWLERAAPHPAWDHAYYNYDVGRGGFGPVFPILLLPSILFSFYIALKTGLRNYLVVLAMFILAFILVPMNWWSRFTIFFCAFGILSFTLIMEHLPNKKNIAIVATSIMVFTLIVGNSNAYYTPDAMVDYISRPLAERQSSDFFCRIWGNNTEIFQKISEKPGSTILYTDVPYEFSYLLWDSNFTNTVINIPKHYVNYEEFIQNIKKFGESQILTTDDSDIMKYCKDHETVLRLAYEKENWGIILYSGGDDVQKE